MRAVHDILYPMEPGAPPGPCAFIQHGKEETGFEYEVVCPWCAKTVGERIASPDPFTYGALLKALRLVMKEHMTWCSGSGHKLQVYVTTVPLNTEDPPKVM